MKVVLALSDSEVFKPKTEKDFARLSNSKNQRKLSYDCCVNDCDIFTMRGGVVMVEYKLWRDMVTRCFSEKYSRFYEDVKIDSRWYKFSGFLHDIKQMKSYEKVIDGWVLDKDILSGKNKIYSRETCCIIPQEINVLFSTAKAIRGDFPVGVSKTRGNKYVSESYKGGVKHRLGFYDTPEDAFYAYKKFKETNVKEVAERYKQDIDERVYNVLISYEVKITD